MKGVPHSIAHESEVCTGFLGTRLLVFFGGDSVAPEFRMMMWTV